MDFGWIKICFYLRFFSREGNYFFVWLLFGRDNFKGVRFIWVYSLRAFYILVRRFGLVVVFVDGRGFLYYGGLGS